MNVIRAMENIFLFQKTQLIQFPRNSKLLLLLKKFETCENELVLTQDILYPFLSSALSLKSPNVRSLLSSSAKWKTKLDKTNQGTSWKEILNVQTKLSMAYTLYKSSQHIHFVHKDEFNILFNLCFNVLTTKIYTSFQESSNNFIQNNCNGG